MVTNFQVQVLNPLRLQRTRLILCLALGSESYHVILSKVHKIVKIIEVLIL